MKRTMTPALAALALTLSVGLTACGADDAEPTAGAQEQSQVNETPEDTQSEDAMADGAGAQTFGEGCSLIPADGAGSFDGMATEPVATAASANPLLTTLVSAVDRAGLVDTLNSAADITVFAPTDDAFAKIGKKDLDAVLKDKKMLTSILTHHVVEGRLAPDELAGTHTTLNGDRVTVDGEGEMFEVGAEDSQVLCGNIPTANATVYVVDTVLMPTAS